MTPRTVEKLAVRLAASGIAAGAIASRHIAALCGHDNAIGLDMGGTSTDISLVYDGEPKVTKEWSVEYGYPIRFPSIEVLTIGAGGGSLAWIDEAGSLRNGPQSAGADPGPACYGRGGEEPTEHRRQPAARPARPELIGGGMELDRDAAEAAIRDKIAEPLGLDTIDAANAIIEVANANMADAVRLISIRKGYDPREFALVVFGGAGPLHGAALAKELMIPTVIVPAEPGRHLRARLPARRRPPRPLRDVQRQGRRGRRAPRSRRRSPSSRRRRARCSTPRASPRIACASRARSTCATSASGARCRSRSRHRSSRSTPSSRRSTTSTSASTATAARTRPVEVYQLNVRAVGETEKAELPSHDGDGGEPEACGSREVVFERGEDAVDAPVYKRDDLPAGASFEGPALIDQLDSTVLVPPGVKVEVDEWLNIRMQIEQEDES